MNHEEMNQRFSRLENEIAELNKKTVDADAF
ncbi:Uncharacterised protein [Escherichia coli]|nr:Uncharacterised protein [Escherichia coli]